MVYLVISPCVTSRFYVISVCCCFYFFPLRFSCVTFASCVLTKTQKENKIRKTLTHGVVITVTVTKVRRIKLNFLTIRDSVRVRNARYY